MAVGVGVNIGVILDDNANADADADYHGDSQVTSPGCHSVARSIEAIIMDQASEGAVRTNERVDGRMAQLQVQQNHHGVGLGVGLGVTLYLPSDP